MVKLSDNMRPLRLTFSNLHGCGLEGGWLVQRHYVEKKDRIRSARECRDVCVRRRGR